MVLSDQQQESILCFRKGYAFEKYGHLNNMENKKETKEIVKRALGKAMTYADYRDRVSALVVQGKSTGPRQTEALANYTLMNDRRMKRFDKTVKIDSETADRISGIQRAMTLLVLTESWCGDAAPTLPVMHKIAEGNAKLDLKIVLRDENPDLMDRFLTKGAMSIPKLILIDTATGDILGDWGPRPGEATKLVEAYKAEHGQLTAEFREDLQRWYNKDKGSNTITDLVRLLLEQVGNGALL